MNESLLYRTSEFVIRWLFFALMLAATEIGFRLGRKVESRTPDNVKSQISTVEAALLGVLALFWDLPYRWRYPASKTVSNSCWKKPTPSVHRSLRAQLLPTPAGPEIAGLLREYANVRVQYGTAGNDLGRLEDLNRQTARLQTQIWTRAVAYAQEDPNPLKAGLLLQSLNQAIDVAEARWMAFQNHVPENVIYVNAAVGLISAMLVGYSFGVNGRRNIFSMCVLAVSITLVLSVIIDLDRPRSGYIRGSQQPMIDLLQRR